MLVNPAEQLQQLQEEEKSDSCPAIQISPAPSDITMSPSQHSSSDCIIIDSELDQITDITSGQYDDAPEKEEVKEKKKGKKNVGECPSIADTECYDPNAQYCICRQKHNKRFMICCDSCQEWFHGDCVGITETQCRKIKKKGQEYICPPCTAKEQFQTSKPHLQPEPERMQSYSECITLSPSGEQGEGEQQAFKETLEKEEEEVPVIRPDPEPEMETNDSLHLCIGPGCSKEALPDSGYCGTDCILQHAAVTMKTLSGPKVPKPRARAQRKTATFRPPTRGQRSGRTSKRLAGNAEEEGEEEEMKEDGGGHAETASSLACNPSLIEVQTPSIPSSQFYTASAKKDIEEMKPDSEAVTQTESPEDMATDAAPSSQHVSEPAPPQNDSQEKEKEPEIRGVPKHLSAESDPSITQHSAKSVQSLPAQFPSTSVPRHHETGALIVSKTAYVIPKKQAGPQPPSSSHMLMLASCQNPSSAPTLLGESRNLLVPPAPSAPSSRPSQPNNQVRQSIQRTLSSILLKRVCDCDDLEMSESEVAKLVASVEMEMFDIFRNTDSKYMNKYRTIMFNLKDPRNKGLLYRVVRGEISAFRLVRMSQKDMQAIQAPEESENKTEVKDVAAKATSLGQKPEAVKVQLPSLNPARPDRRPDKRPDSTEHKRGLPAPALKTRANQPSQVSAAPDILTSMLKDTTSEHKAHLFDLKCKICTGQIQAGDEDEPAKKKPKVSGKRNKREPSWRHSAGEDSPLRAPPDSPDMDSPITFPMDPTSRLIIDSPALTIVDSPASPTMDSPASPIMESPASPVMEHPTSPTQDVPTASMPKRAYTPVMIPAVSTVTITRRDPRTAASRFSALSGSTMHNQPAPFDSLKETSSALPSVPVSSLPPMKPLPKSILMKPSSSADPRLYGTSSRTMISESPADCETVQFLAKQEIMWKGFLNMVTVAKFVTKAYLVSGSAEILKGDLPDTIQIGGRIMPQTVWDYVAKLKTSVTKELCVIRFHPATEEEEVAYVSLFSYFSSRGRFGVVANNSRSIKDIYLVPLSAKESVPSILQPLEGPGLEKRRPNLLLGLAIIQKAKRPGSLSHEIDEKRPSVHMSKDPMWIPKPPVLYGSDKLEIFQPYDPETPASTSPPGSPSCPGSPSDSSSSGSITIPSLLTSIRASPPVSSSSVVAATQSNSNSMSEKNLTTASSNKTPLQTILKTLFSNKQTETTVSYDVSSTKTTSDKKTPVFSQVSCSMVDPIVQQYGQKSKVKEIEQDENDFDRPYDPEEEYDPAIGYGMVASQNVAKNKADGPALLSSVDDDVAYDPEDETIFEDIQSEAVVTKALVPNQTSDSSALHCPTPPLTQVVPPANTSTPPKTSTSTIMPNLPTGTVVVSAATLTEQQRMLEELNKQIEEQKRQLKEQEEALRQQREAVGMFMAHFSVSDSLMSPPTKSLPPSQLSSQTTDKTSNLTETMGKLNADSQNVKEEDTTAIVNLKKETDIAIEKDEAQENIKEGDKYSSAGEIEDSDVAYDPEDESLFNEIQEDVFQGSSIKICDSSLSKTRQIGGHKGASSNSHHSRKRRLSPKRRNHRERDRHRSPSRRSELRSPSHSRRRRERDRHRRRERDRSKHRTRDQSECQARHRKEHTTRRRSRGHRRSPSSPRKNQHREPSPQDLEKSKQTNVPQSETSGVGQFLESNTLSSAPVTIKNDPDGHLLKCSIAERADKDFFPFSHELCKNVKLESSEAAKSHKVQKDLVSDHDDKGNESVAQVDKPAQQEILLKDKLESTIPLREIDPPIRDSPESPDPDPQFVKPSSIEKSDSVESEENRDFETQTSFLPPCVKVENNCFPIGGQATVSNLLWPTVESPVSEVSNMNFRTINLQGPVVGPRDQGMINKQAQEEKAGIKHVEIMAQGDSHSESATDSAIQSSQPETDYVTGVSGTSIMNPGPAMKGPGPLTGISSPGPNVRSTSIWGLGQHIQDTGTAMQSSDSNMRESGIKYLKTDEIASGSGMRKPLQNMDKTSTTIQGMNTEIQCPDIKQSEQEIRGQNIVAAVTNSQLQVPNSKASVMEVGEDQCFGSSQIEDGAPDFMGRGRGHSKRGERAHTVGMRSCMRGGGERGQSRDPSFWGPKRVQRQARHNDNPVFVESCPQKRSFEPHIRNSDFSGVGHGREFSNEGIGSEINIVEWQVPQRGRGAPIRGTRPNIKYESDRSSMSCTRQDRNETTAHLREPQTMHELRRQDIEGSYMGPGQIMDSICDSDKSGDITLSNAGTTGRNIGEMSPNRRDTDLQGKNIQGLGVEWRNEQMGQQHRGPVAKRKNRDGRGPEADGVGPNMRNQRSQNIDRDPHREDLGWSEIGSDLRDHWTGTERRGSGPVRGRPFIKQSDRTEPNMENLGPNRVPGGPELMAPIPDMNVPIHDRRGPGGPDSRRREPEKEDPTMDNLGPRMKGPGVKGTGLVMEGPGIDWRGPPVQQFRNLEPERIDSGMESQGHDIQGPLGPDLMVPWPERRGPDMVGPGPDRKRPRGQDVWGTGPERCGPAIEGPGAERQEPEGPDFKGPLFERRGPTMRGARTDRLRPRGSVMRGTGLKSRGSSMEVPGPDRGGPGCPNFRGPGSDRSIESSESDRRGFGGQRFWGQGPENRGLFLEGPEPDSRGPIGPGFSEPGPERRGPAMGAAGPERRPEGPDCSGLGPDRRGPTMVCLGPDRRELGNPSFRGSGHERRGPAVVNQETHKRGPGGPDFWEPNYENIGPAIDRAGPGQRGPGSLELRGPRSERRGPSIENQGPNRRGPGDQNADGLGPDRRGSYTGRPGPDCIGLGPEGTHPGLDGPDPHCRELGGPPFRAPRLGSGLPNMDDPGPGRRDSRIRGQWLEGPGMKVRGPISRGSGGQNVMGLGAEHRLPNMEEMENDHNFPQGPPFGDSELEKRPPDMKGPDTGRRGPHFRQTDLERTAIEGQGKGQRGPDFRRPGCESRGPDTVDSALNRQELEGLDFREPGSERRSQFLQGPGPDWRKSGCPDFRGPRIRQTCQNMEGPTHDSRDECRGSEFREPESMQESHNIEYSGPERKGQPLRGPWPMRRNRPGTDMNSLNRGDRWKNTDTEDQWSDGRGPDMETVLNETESLADHWKRHGNRGPEKSQDYRRQGPRAEWRGPGSREPLPIQERSDSPFSGPMRVPEAGWTGPGGKGPGPVHDGPHIMCPAPNRGGCENEWKEPNQGGSGQKRGAHGPFFSGQRNADNEGQYPGIRGSDMRGGPDMGNDWRQPDFRGNMKGPGLHRGDPGCGGLGSESPGPIMESHRPGRRGFEYNIRRERRGPDVREPGLDKNSDIRHGPDRWEPNTEVPGSDTRSPATIGLGVDSRESETPRKSKLQASDFRGPGYVNREPDMNYREPGQRGQTSNNERRGPAFRYLDKSGHLVNSQHGTRFTGPSHPHSAPFNRPPAPTPHSRVKSCPGFDNPQNQQAINPQRHRAALLPTPTEGLIRFPNHMTNNPDGFSLKQKQFGQPTDREWRRGRVSRERDSVRGQRQEQEKSSPGKINTFVVASTRDGEEKKTEDK